MKKPLKQIPLLLSLITISTSITPVYAQSHFLAKKEVSDVKAQNQLRSGTVNIDLVENLLQSTPKHLISPGSVFNHDLTIINNAAPAWVRVKIQYNNDAWNDYVKLHFPNKNFKHIGDYWYYTKPLKSTETLLAVDNVTFSDDTDKLDLQTLSEGFVLTEYAEAIQAKNFKPDFTSNDPWLDPQ